MSIYSGFATRQQESTYNKFVHKALEILSEEVLKKRKIQVFGANIGKLDI